MNRRVMANSVVLLWLLCAVPCVAVEENAHLIEVYISHQLSFLITEELTVRFTVHNRADRRQSFAGEITDETGKLILTGDWRLVLEEVKEDKTVWTKDLCPKKQPQAKVIHLERGGNTAWKATIPLRQLVSHSGIYRFQLGLEGYSKVGRLFRVEEEPVMPEGISLTYTPDKTSYFIGEPISVHFVMRNGGKDELHFEEGGDYRGANRHLRYTFKAESQNGAKAVDPKPSQPCFGGLGMVDQRLKPGETYEKDLPLLAYLTFPGPGKYTVECHQALGIGFPKRVIEEAGGYEYVYGSSFDIELRLPSKEEAADLLRSFLAEPDEYKRKRHFSSLYHGFYLKPLLDLVQEESDKENIEALVDGIASIVTVSSTRSLIELARDEQQTVRIAALKRLSWRLPDPRDTGQVKPDSPFTFYSSDARRRDSKASWDSTFRAALLKILKEGLESETPEEVSVCAYCLGALAEADTIKLLVRAADRMAPSIPVAPERERCVNQIASAASLLARLDAKPCKADKQSSPGRLAVWANMIRTKKEYRAGNWEEIILHMLNLDCGVTRMAAIRWLPGDFAQRENIPWKKLFLEENRQTWWHAIQVARKKFPENLKEITLECIEVTSDKSKRREFERLAKEIEKSNDSINDHEQ